MRARVFIGDCFGRDEAAYVGDCPDCLGEGEIEIDATTPRDWSPASRYESCFRCEGRGRVRRSGSHAFTYGAAALRRAVKENQAGEAERLAIELIRTAREIAA